MVRALVIEDEAMSRELCVEMLEGLGYEVTARENSVGGITLMQSGQEFDLILCDVVNKGPTGHHGGVDTAEYVLSNHPLTTLVMMTGTPDIWEDAIKNHPMKTCLEAIPFIVKTSVPIAQMGAVIQAAMSRRAAGSGQKAKLDGSAAATP